MLNLKVDKLEEIKVMPDTNPDQISKNDVKPGDMLLYVLLETPKFKEFTKENEWDNFSALIDLLIIKMSRSMCTHAALVASAPDTAVEATLPNCRYRKGIYNDGYKVLVRRVNEAGKGPEVLNYLPPGINPDTSAPTNKNLPYAYAQSAVAALFCLFRNEAPLDPLARDAMLVFLQLLLHPLAKAIDDFIAERSGQDSAWFCSQLVTHCYDQAAKTDSAFKLHFPAIDSANKTLFGWLVSQVPANALPALASAEARKAAGISRLASVIPEFAGDEIMHAGISLLSALEGKNAVSANRPLAATAPALHEAVALVKNSQKAAEGILVDAYHLLSLLGINNPDKTPSGAFDEYKEALIMPSDLERETALQHIGVLYDKS